MKKIMIVMLISLFMLTGCGKEQTLTDEDGNMLKLTQYEISEDGFYVHNKKDNTFTPVMSGADGFDNIANTEGDTFTEMETKGYGRYVWFNSDSMMKLIPKINEDSELVIVAGKEGNMPEEYVLEKYKNLGPTIGAHFTFGETGTNLFIDTDGTCNTSMAEEVLSKSSDGLLRVHKINESKKLPVDNIDPEIGMLLGLEKNKKYQVGFFDGTEYQDETFISDTIAMKSVQTTRLSSDSIVTEENYFIVNLPKNMASGYYYINDAGMFKYVR